MKMHMTKTTKCNEEAAVLIPLTQISNN